MKQKTTIFTIGIIFLLGLFSIANATLIRDNVNGYVIDDKGTSDLLDDQFWLQVSRFQNLSTSKQLAIDTINNSVFSYNGYSISPWSLATNTEITELYDYGLDLTNYFTRTRYAGTLGYLYSTNHNYFIEGLFDNEGVSSLTSKSWKRLDYRTHFGSFTSYSITDGVDSAEQGAWVTTYIASQEGLGSSPVPEPSSILLFGIGFLGLTGICRRKG